MHPFLEEYVMVECLACLLTKKSDHAGSIPHVAKRDIFNDIAGQNIAINIINYCNYHISISNFPKYFAIFFFSQYKINPFIDYFLFSVYLWDIT